MPISKGDTIVQYGYMGSNRGPSFVLENGEFVDGIYLVLVDAAAESNGAESTTIYDLIKDGYPRGRDEDKYAFCED